MVLIPNVTFVTCPNWESQWEGPEHCTLGTSTPEKISKTVSILNCSCVWISVLEATAIGYAGLRRPATKLTSTSHRNVEWFVLRKSTLSLTKPQILALLCGRWWFRGQMWRWNSPSWELLWGWAPLLPQWRATTQRQSCQDMTALVERHSCPCRTQGPMQTPHQALQACNFKNTHNETK